MAKLTPKQRKSLSKSTFAIPSTRSYPIPDRSHAQNALARVAQNGTPAQKKQVKAAVAKKFPAMSKAKPKVKPKRKK